MWLLLPWGEDFLTNLGQVAHWFMCGTALYAIARHTGIGRPGALIGGMTAMLIPGIIQQVTVSRVDVAFSAWMLVSIFFALKWGETRKFPHLILFGAAFGLFCGTKSLAVLYCVVPALIFLLQISDRGTKAFSDIAVVVCVAVVTGGFWYIRNWVLTGNPFFPMQFSPGGVHIFKGAYGPEAMQFFHTSDKDELKRIWLFFFGIWMMFAVMFSTLGAMLLVLARKRSGIGKLFMLSAPWIICLLFWYVNPHNNLTNGRFVFPAFMLFCYSIALIINNGKEKWTWAWGLIVIAAIVASGLLSGTDHLYLLMKDLFMASLGKGNGLLAPATAAVRLLWAGVVVTVSLFFIRTKKTKLAVLLIGTVLIASGMFFAWNYHINGKYKWYATFPEGSAWAMLDRMTEGLSVNIASVGSERIYGLFGTGMRNNVFPVSITENPSLDFHDYWKEAMKEGKGSVAEERPQWHRLGGTPEAWIKNLHEAEISFVFAVKLDPMGMSVMDHDMEGFPIEVLWADDRPDVFRLKYDNENVRIYAVAPEQK